MASNVNAWTGLASATSNLPQLAMGMYKLKRDEEDKDTALAIARDRSNLEREIHANDAAYKQAMIAKAQAETPTHKQKMDPSLITKSKMAAKVAYGDEGLKAWNTMYDAIAPVVEDPNGTKGDAYKASLSMWPSIRETMKADLEKILANEKLDPIKRQRLEKVYDSVVYDKTGENVLGNGVFSETARSMKMEEENSKAALLAEREAGLNARADQRDERIRDLAAENLALRREKEARLAGEGERKKDKETKKELDKAIRRVTDQIAAYDKEINDYTKRMDKASEKDQQWYQDAIDARNEQKAQSQRTKDMLLNGEIEPSQVRWGGGASAQASPQYKSADDVRAAFQAGKLTEEQATKILQSQFGFK